MRQYPQQFDRAQEVMVASHQPAGRLPLGALALLGAISVPFWVTVAHGLSLL